MYANISEKPSNIKLHATVYGYNQDDCNIKFKTSHVTVKSSQLCAIGNNTDTCSGDSGGPILALAQDPTNPRKTYWYAAGITSFGKTECNTLGWPGVYTRTSFYMEWIYRKLTA